MIVGDQLNLQSVDWDRSYPATNKHLSLTIPVYQIVFTNGAYLAAFDGAIIAFQRPDAYGNIDTPPRDPKQFFGTIKKDWRALAKAYEEVLETEFGFGEKVFSDYRVSTGWGYADTPIGAETHVPIQAAWLRYFDPSVPGYAATMAAIPQNERIPGFTAEFNLHDGEMKGFAFHIPRLIDMFVRAQKSGPAKQGRGDSGVDVK
jgi:hypothetical protein